MKKRVILAGQNETIRKSSEEENVSLATFGLIGCVAVIVSDENGNASLTHVDAHTDLSFIKDEVKLMDGDYTIDVVKDKMGQGQLDQKVLGYLEENFPDIHNSRWDSKTEDFKGDKDARTTMHGGVLFKSRKIFKLDPKDVGEIHALQEHYGKGSDRIDRHISEDNQIKTLEIDEGTKPLQSRIYDQQLFEYLKADKERKPDIVYSEGEWTKNFYEPKEFSRTMTRLKAARQKDLDNKPNNSVASFLIQEIFKVIGKDFKKEYGDMGLKQKMDCADKFPGILVNMWGHQDRLAEQEKAGRGR